MPEEIKDPEGLLKAYNKAKEDLVNLRAELKVLQDEREALSEEAVDKWKHMAIKSQALAELQAQGIKNPERILKYMDFDGVEIDDDDKVSGLEDKLESVKTDFPELFDPKKRAGRESADIHEQKPAKKDLSPTEQQVAALFG